MAVAILLVVAEALVVALLLMAQVGPGVMAAA
jgi:hypothetical protein